MEDMRGLTTIDTKLHNLSNMFSIWQFNSYLRVTYVAPNWLVIWDHRHSPPVRHDIKEDGDHEEVCRLAADQLRRLSAEPLE